MIQDFNYHTHTYRCGHARGTDEEYVLAAIKAGYKVLGFSDHGPYKGHSIPRARMDWDQLDDYISSINYLKEKYRDQIEIRLGIESEFLPESLEEKRELKDRVEYLLLGQHFAFHDNRRIDYFSYNSDEEILEYARTVCLALETGMFSYLCHPDVFLNKQSEFTDACYKAADMIARKCVETDTPMEINLRGVLKGKQQFTDGMQYWYPNLDFWKVASKYPIKCVYGVDAHDPKELLMPDLFENAEKELRDLNLNFIEIKI